MPSPTPPPTYQDAVIQGILSRTGTTPFPDAPRLRPRSLRAPSVAPPPPVSSNSSSYSSGTAKTPLKTPIKPIMDDPIPRPAEKPKDLSKSGWQSDTSHSRQKEGILKSYRKKIPNKSSPSPPPSGHSGVQVNSLIAYHPHRPLLVMDLAKPLSKVKLGGDLHVPVRDIDLDQLATSSPLSSMRIQCELFQWPVNVRCSKKTGITHRDVILAVREVLYTNIKQKEWEVVKDPHREWVKQAFERRCRNSEDLYAIERQRGLRRVDMLTEKTIWKGISTRDGSGVWTLHLSNR